MPKAHGFGGILASALDGDPTRALGTMGRASICEAGTGKFGEGTRLLTTVWVGSVGLFDVFPSCGDLCFIEDARSFWFGKRTLLRCILGHDNTEYTAPFEGGIEVEGCVKEVCLQRYSASMKW